MKATLRIPTKEQYAYIEVETEGTQEEIIAEYKDFTNKIMGGFGVERLEFNKILDKYLLKGEILSEDYERLSLVQQNIINEIKKSISRQK